MPKLPTNAHIVQIEDKIHYEVKIDWVPRAGDLINLYSFADAAAKHHPENHRYEVVRVLHDLTDIAESVQQSHNGSHFVTIFVKSSEDSSFDSQMTLASS